uniref:Retrotransposon Copia-like N-terminal domain-containing protein n=1 Tax=Setaria viridis TaxID=4556 RepID=A0A4U6W842_SETVI|nr:hypothetical protein SEVIR_1G129000v2 [Setaria viridis]
MDSQGSVEDIAVSLRAIIPLNGNNFHAWKKDVQEVLMILDLYYALREDKPVAPIMCDSFEYAHKFDNYTVDIEKWEKFNRIAKRIIK